MKSPIVIITPIPIEYQAVRKQLINLQSQHDKKNQLIYETGAYNGKKGKYKIVLIQKGKGIAEITQATQLALSIFQPPYIFLVGTAAGIKKVALGDIVIGTRGYNYESGREQSTQFVPTIKVAQSSEVLTDIANLVSYQDKWANLKKYKVFAGPIVSGEKVVETRDTKVFATIHKHYPDAIALEMEAYGFLKTASNNPTTQPLIIRGISDFMDDKQVVNQQGSRELAATNAATFTMDVIEQLQPTRNIRLLVFLGMIGLLLFGIYIFHINQPPKKSFKTITYNDTTTTNIKVEETLPTPVEAEEKTSKPSPIILRLPVIKSFTNNISLLPNWKQSIEQNLELKHTKNKEATYHIEWRDTRELIQNPGNSNYYYTTSGNLEITVDGTICCCTSISFPAQSRPGNRQKTLEKYMRQELQDSINANLPAIIHQLKACL